jgi:hypothetical protein
VVTNNTLPYFGEWFKRGEKTPWSGYVLILSTAIAETGEGPDSGMTGLASLNGGSIF